MQILRKVFFFSLPWGGRTNGKFHVNYVKLLCKGIIITVSCLDAFEGLLKKGWKNRVVQDQYDLKNVIALLGAYLWYMVFWNVLLIETKRQYVQTFSNYMLVTGKLLTTPQIMLIHSRPPCVDSELHMCEI